MNRKITQIAFDTEGDSESGIASDMWALCDDGSLWILVRKDTGQEWYWRFIDHPIPQGSLGEVMKANFKG